MPLSRRDFLAAAAASTVAGSLSATPMNRKPAKSCIFLHLVGGPSHLDTFDPKPDAPNNIRGPFDTMPTAVPGVHLSELLPKTASRMKDISLIRSLHHNEAPIHENGFQLLHTGRRYGDGKPWPGMGAVIHHLLGDGPLNHTEKDDFPSWWSFAQSNIETGVDIDRGFSRADLPSRGYDVPLQPFSNQRDNAYPLWVTVDGAVTAVRSGARFVNLFMYETVFDKVSWDCHADRGRLSTDLNDYRETVCHTFDHAFDQLIGQLKDRRLFDQTLVVAAGEFGRTPKLNANGGRDHWPGCWTALIAGGGVQGGRVIGSSDAIGAEPNDRPVTCPELVATIYHAMGIPSTATIPDPNGKPVRIVEAEPVLELF